MRSSSWVSVVLAGLTGLAAVTTAAAAPVGTTSPRTPASPRAAAAPPAGLSHHDPAANGLVITKAAAVAGSPRSLRGIQWQRPVARSSSLASASSSSAAPGTTDPWSQFVHQSGGKWQSAWDSVTQTPVRVWGQGLEAPGSMASPAIAEAFARKVLADHLALWAPGTSPADYRLVANDFDGDIRTLGFAQTYQGLAVIGGQVSFRFKRDRLVVIASEAIPGITATVPARRSRMSATRMRQQIGEGLSSLGLPASARVVAPAGAEPVLLPILGDSSVLGYRVVVPHHIEGDVAGRWMLYADAQTGETVGFESLSFYGQGQLKYRVVTRYPGGGREDVAAGRVNAVVGGAPAVTTAAGNLTWAGTAPQTVVPAVAGALVTTVNKAGMAATTSLTLNDGNSVVWDASAVPADDAQLNVVIHVNQVKEYVRTFAPDMPTLDMPINTNINIDMECNASFDGTNLNFYRSSTRCENTGLLADVVYHEFGHAMHFSSIIPGVGRMEGAFSEGLSDFLAASITEDAGMGRGFFYSSTPLRDLDPAGKEPRWPEDIGEIHKTGVIFGAAMWDLRKALIAQLGRAAAVPVINRLFYAAVRRASDIPTTLVEILLADDDDGNLDNGTPNECAILDHFGKHGLRVVTGVSESPGTVIAAAGAKQEVSFTLLGRSPRCATDAVASLEVSWSPSPSGQPGAGKVQATPTADPDRYVALLPLPNSDVLKFNASVIFSSGIKVLLPDNFADYTYHLYEGETVPLLCASMDENPLTSPGWIASAGWAWGPAAATGKTDPRASFSGQNNVLAIGLGADYLPDTTYELALPKLDVGRYSDVRLQFRRWLSVEDSEFDEATISANGKVVWVNASDHIGNDSALHHLDREWRFQDVPLSSRFRGSELNLSFGLTTDGGLEFGGWAIDDLCIVANPASICGDGALTGSEECDDAGANADSPNKCRLDCKRAACGDGIVDRGEECDDGEGTEHCAATCLLMDDSGGCCDARGNSAASMVLTLGVLGLVLRRRRSRKA